MGSHKDNFRDTLYTIDKSGRRRWVYMQHLVGKFGKRRTLVAYSLMLFYLTLPWVTIQGMQGVLLDIPARRFIFFGTELWATDTIFLALFFAIMGLSLFFFTALFGRVWCGWACPETIFLEFLFRPIERLIEGGPAERLRLDMAPWSARKVLKKVLKHGFCALAAWILASTALAYFIGREPLLAMMTDSPLNHPVPFAMTLALMGVMAFQFGWFREQFCTVLCPYARFQSVLMDAQSLLVGYDAHRGEPRGKLRETGKGDCIDCHLCVRVCPTGIDIRNGTQLECIACANCVDACDSVMRQIGRSPGLIRYDTENALGGAGPRRLLRPRVVLYGALLTLVIGIFVTVLLHRSTFDLEVVRVAAGNSTPFTLDTEGMVLNQFSVRVANKSRAPVTIVPRIKESKNVTIISPLAELTLTPGQSEQIPLFLRAPQSFFSNGRAAVEINFTYSAGENFERTVTIWGPVK